MTNPNKAELFILIDRSGSMDSIMSSMIEGINKLIDEQRQIVNKELNVTIATFDGNGVPYTFSNNSGGLHPLGSIIPATNTYTSIIPLCIEKVYDRTNVRNVKRIPSKPEGAFLPRGMTPLNDAFCTCVDELGNRLASLPEHERPSKVMFMTITDGHENMSTLFKASDVKERTKTQHDIYKWEFLYLGANQDAWGVADGIGVTSAGTYTASAAGVDNALNGASYIAANYLQGNFTGCMRAATFSTSGVIDEHEDPMVMRARIAATSKPSNP